jgi:hypothetical protein
MSSRVLERAGVLIALGSAVVMTAYTLTVGAEHAEPLVRALGAFAGLAGLALVAVARDRRDRRRDDSA